MTGLLSVAKKELRHLLRDPATLFIALAIPVFQLTIFGFAIDFDVRQIATVVADLDRSRESRRLVQAYENTDYLDVVRYVANPEQALAEVRTGRARVAIVIPPDFARKAGGSQPPVVKVLLDGSDSQVATRARMALATRATGPPEFEARVDVLYNPDMRTETFMIPGLIGVIMQIVTVALTSFSLVREREQGTLEQLMVSPLRPFELVLGKLAPYAGLAFLEMVLVLVAGRLVFDVRVAGSTALLLFLSAPFMLAALSMGLLISTVAKNQAQALMLTLLIMLPSILMSGFVFPRETMPGVLYLVSEALPVTHFLHVIRGVAVRGATLVDLAGPTAMLCGITAALIFLAVRRFGKSIE